MAYTGEHRTLPGHNHIWCWLTVPEETTPEQLSQFFFECSIAIPAENFSIKPARPGTASVLCAIPFESFEPILQWLFEEKRLPNNWKVTPRMHKSKPKPVAA